MAKNYDHVINQLQAAGLLIDHLETGRIVRCKVEGERERRGWYRLYELPGKDGSVLLVGSYGVWQGASNNAQKIELPGKDDLTTDQAATLRKRMAEDNRRAQAMRKAEAGKAARHAQRAWAQYVATGTSDYLARKGVQGHGIKYTPGGAAVVPLLDANGTVQGLQIIRTAAQAKERRRPTKEFWPKGVAKKGHFHLIGHPGWLLLVAEGYATAASLHEASGLPVAVAFDAGNLAPVCEALAKRYPRSRILVCADDDCWTAENPGITRASSAAVLVDGAWIAPSFSDEAARQAKHAANGHKLSDFNDLHLTDGLHAVRSQIEARLLALGWSQPAAPSGEGNHTRGEGLTPIGSLDELLERFFTVYGQGGTVFDDREHILLSNGDMRDACRSRGLHREWAEHPDRQIVRKTEVGFDPTGTDGAIRCNLWGGWPTVPQAGQCLNLLALLEHLCSDDPKSAPLFDWVLKWLAYPIQHPGAKMKTALVVHGPQGVGKNLFFEAVMAIYGEYGRVIDQAAVEDKFNDWASRKLFMIADEVVARSDVYHIKNKLKSFITGDTIRINPKNIASYEERNHVNVVFMSNETMPVVLEEDDRRHAVIWTPPGLSPERYSAVHKEIRSGGIAALHDYLLNLNLGDFSEHSKPPESSARRELINQSLDSTSRFFYALTAGEIDNIEPRPALSQDVYDVYKRWCYRNGINRAAPLPRLSSAFNRRHNVEVARKRFLDFRDIKTKNPQSVMYLPGNHPALEPSGDENKWLGESIAAFRRQVDDYLGKNHD